MKEQYKLFKTKKQFYQWLQFFIEDLDFNKSITSSRFSFFVGKDFYHCPNMRIMCEKLNNFLPEEAQLDEVASRIKGQVAIMIFFKNAVAEKGTTVEEAPVEADEPEEELITLEVDKPDWDKVDAMEDKDELADYAESFKVTLAKNAKLENMKKKFKNEYSA